MTGDGGATREGGATGDGSGGVMQASINIYFVSNYHNFPANYAS